MIQSEFEFYRRMLDIAYCEQAPRAVVADIQQRLLASGDKEICAREENQEQRGDDVKALENQYVMLQKQLVRALREEWPEADVRRLILAVQSVHKPHLNRLSA